MTKKFLLAFAWIVITVLGYSQSAGKLGLRLKTHLEKDKITTENVSLLVKGDLDKVKALTQKYNGYFKYGYGNIASITIPENKLVAFSSEIAVERIQRSGMKGMLLMDTARIRNNIDSAQQGFAPLADSLLGKGVIIGIIDGGIYWQHKDFKNPDGTTRFLYIWDQTVHGGNAPLPYHYGNEWSWVDMNNGNCTETDPDSGPCADISHGTCVTGIAAGNGSSLSGNPHLAGKYTGVAPESNIIFVNIGAGGTCTASAPHDDFLAEVADAVDYIFKKADALGMPCVINTSVGTYYGSHDGLDLTAQLIDNLLDQRKGRVVVAAAGNTGNVPLHLSYNIPADSAYTFFSYYNPLYFDLWADTANFNQANFTIGCNDKYGNNLGRLDYFNLVTNLIPNNDDSTYISRELYNGNINLGLVEILASIVGNRYHVEFQITPDSTSYLWRLQTSGSGTFDLWASSTYIGTADMVNYLPTGNVGNPTVYIQYPNYYHPDTLKTIVSSWQCSDKVITVGNYSNRAGYLDYDSVYIDMTVPSVYNSNNSEVVGKRYVTSSFGPTRDNRLKPDIMATGSTTLCTGDALDISLKLNNSLHYKVALGGKHLRNGGTSMSSPLVAGIAALYLQKHPTATYDEVKKALICTAVKDSFTGFTANPEYGNGKVNAFDALTSTNCITFGSADTACFNYNILANVDSGGCVIKRYGCMDSTASNYDSLANVPNGVCTYISSVKNLIGEQVSLQVVPNPFNGQTTFNIAYGGYDFRKGEIDIINQLGDIADVIPVNKNSSAYTYLNQKLAAGIYFYQLRLDDKLVKTGKLIAE